MKALARAIYVATSALFIAAGVAFYGLVIAVCANDIGIPWALGIWIAFPLVFAAWWWAQENR